MRKRLLGATAISAPILLASIAPAFAVPPVPYFDWTGFYVGAHAGFAVGNTYFSGNTNIVPAGDSLGVAYGSGFSGGGQGGYNYQVSPHVVVGVEGDFTWTNLVHHMDDPFFSGKNLSSRTNGLASIAARGGYTGGDYLFFGKVGPAWINNQYSFGGTGFFPFVPGFNDTGMETRLGIVAGGGIEWKVAPTLTAKFEVDFYGLSPHLVTLTNTSTGGTLKTTITQNIEVFEFGLNYHFSGPFHGPFHGP